MEAQRTIGGQQAFCFLVPPSWPGAVPPASGRTADGFYVAEIRAGMVHRFAADGHFVRHYAKPGDGPGELRLPAAVAVVADTLVAISDFGHQSVDIFDRATGSFVTRIALPLRAELLVADARRREFSGSSVAGSIPGRVRPTPQHWALRHPTVHPPDHAVIWCGLREADRGAHS